MFTISTSSIAAQSLKLTTLLNYETFLVSSTPYAMYSAIADLTFSDFYGQNIDHPEALIN